LAEVTQRTRYRTIGILIFLMGIAGYFCFANGVDPKLQSTFGLNNGTAQNMISLPDLIIPSFWGASMLSALCVAIGLYQVLRGFRQKTNLVLGIAILFFIFAFLIWAARDSSMNLTGMLRLSVVQAIPLTLGALSGILCERSGVVNIAIEGLMLISSLVSVIVASVTHNLWLGLLAAVMVSGLVASVHAILCLHYLVDQVVSGMVINVFAQGITSFITIKFLVSHPAWNQTGLFPTTPIPVLSRIPILGPIFFNQSIFLYFTILLLIVIQFALYNTRWGLRTRMVGENPKAAATLGINVIRVRYLSVILGGFIAGIAGSYLTLGAVGRFDQLMTTGRGYIGLAAMIFGNWNPIGASGASLIFGFASSLQSKLSILNTPIPSEFLLMAPYIATMIVLAGVVGRVVAPAADGQPYDENE
jgi:simple sugar transport system permease protein